MLARLTQLSRLQIYGAALDGEPLLPKEASPAPPHGTDLSRQVALYPNKPLNPKAGITYLKFSIPGPTQTLIDLVESQHFQHRDWQALKREIFRLFVPARWHPTEASRRGTLPRRDCLFRSAAPTAA